MIEKNCKVDIRDIDYTVIECGECHSEIRATQQQTNFLGTCPMCRAPYDAFAVEALKNFLEQLKFIDKKKSNTKVYVVTKENHER